MKTIKITKSRDFATNSKVLLHVGSEITHLDGFGSFTFSLNPGEQFYLTHQWVSSKKVSYEKVTDGSFYLVKPRLDKRLAFITLFVFTLCMIFFFIFHSRWSFIPLLPIVIYVLLFLTVWKDRYIFLEPNA